MKAFVVTAVAVLSLTSIVHAQTRGSRELSSESQKALVETQKMLQNPEAVKAHMNTHPQAQRVHDGVNQLMGGNAEDTAAMYKLASEVFGQMAAQNGGDPEAMKRKLEQAQKNPEAFLNSLTPAQKAQISELAKKVEARQPSAAPK